MAAPATQNGATQQSPCRALIADGQLQACRQALASNCVTFHDVATAWFAMTDPALDGKQRNDFVKLYPALRETFAKPRGGIVTAVFCRNIRVAAALTSSDRAAENPEGVIELAAEKKLERTEKAKRAAAVSAAIHVEPSLGDPADWQAKTILFTCQTLHNRAVEFLTPKPRKIGMRMIFGVITALLGMLDARQVPGGGQLAPAEVACLQEELRRTERYIERSMQRQAQLEYFFGMLWSWIALLLAFAAVAGVAALEHHLPFMKEPLVLAAIAGALGAVVSVMQRMTSGRLRLASEDGRGTIRILGAIRPVLGAILGVVLVVLLSGGLMPFDSKGVDADTLPYYVIGLAFIAGFSERFAQDMLSGAAGGLTSGKATAAVSPDRGTTANR
jgi:hypothetical protein